MTEGELDLLETELLLLQHLLDGDNFGAGFENFGNRDLNAAQYKADKRGSVYRTAQVQQSREDGDLSELHFKVDSVVDDRQINVVVGRSGYIRSRQKGNPDLVNLFVGNLYLIHSYRSYLTPLEQLIDSYIHQKDFSDERRSQDGVVQEIHRGFKLLTRDYFSDDEFTESERSVLESIAANIGIFLLEKPLGRDAYPDISIVDDPSFMDYQDRILEFWKDYSVIEGPGVQPDLPQLTSHLDHILNQCENHDNIIDFIEWVEETYDL